MSYTYYGDSIGDAARAEERGLDRDINLTLNNRDYVARQRQLDQQNAEQAAQARAQNYFKQQAADETAQTGDERQRNWAATFGESQRQFDTQNETNQDKLDVERDRLGLAREYRDKVGADKASTGIFNMLLAHIGKGRITGIDDLNAEGAKQLSPDQYQTLLTELASEQRRQAQIDEGPNAIAADANRDYLANNTDHLNAAAWFLQHGKPYKGIHPNADNTGFIPLPTKRTNRNTDAMEVQGWPQEVGPALAGAQAKALALRVTNWQPPETAEPAQNRFPHLFPHVPSEATDPPSQADAPDQATPASPAVQESPEPPSPKRSYFQDQINQFVNRPSDITPSPALPRRQKYPDAYYDSVRQLINSGYKPAEAAGLAKAALGLK